MSWDTNPLYSLLHESIYCQGAASDWAAQRVIETEGLAAQFDAVSTAEAGGSEGGDRGQGWHAGSSPHTAQTQSTKILRHPSCITATQERGRLQLSSVVRYGWMTAYAQFGGHPTVPGTGYGPPTEENRCLGFGLSVLAVLYVATLRACDALWRNSSGCCACAEGRAPWQE